MRQEIQQTLQLCISILWCQLFLSLSSKLIFQTWFYLTTFLITLFLISLGKSSVWLYSTFYVLFFFHAVSFSVSCSCYLLPFLLFVNSTRNTTDNAALYNNSLTPTIFKLVFKTFLNLILLNLTIKSKIDCIFYIDLFE